jgi:hypothetical protein
MFATRPTSEAEFDSITAYFQPPGDDEGFNVIRYERNVKVASKGA